MKPKAISRFLLICLMFSGEVFAEQQQVTTRFDGYAPIIGANSTYLFPGQELEISAGIGAMIKSVFPRVTIGGKNVPIDKNGIATYKTVVSSSGTVPIVIRYKDQNGVDQIAERKIEYTVGTPSGIVVSAEKVKVLYIGLDNELAISGGNIRDERMTVSINNGSLRKIGPGKYVCNPNATGNAVLTVNADGKASQFTFRVKSVPDPICMVGTSRGGVMQANVFKAQEGIRAELDNFLFEGIKYTVKEYTIYLTGAGFPMPQYRQVNGNTFDAVRDLISQAKPGTTITFDEVKVSCPDGSSRRIPGIFFNLR